MNAYLEKVCTGLYKIGSEAYNQDCKDIHLVLNIMAQASADIYRSDIDAGTKKDAREYFNSDVFLYHCKLAGLSDEHSVRRLFLSRPNKEIQHVP